MVGADRLRLFAHVAEGLNIGAAGRSLGMAPSATRIRLARREQTPGVELLQLHTQVA